MLSTNPKPPMGIAQQRMLLADLLLQSSQKPDQTETYPASLAQQRLWFLEQLGVKTSAYNVHLGFWLRGQLDMGALRSSLQELVNRHDSLRTSFRLDGRELVQDVARYLGVDLPITDITSTPDYAIAYGLARNEVEAPFDLGKAPLFRTRLIRDTATDHVLLLTMHHIITDAWSMQILAKELATLYTAFSGQISSPLLDLPITYGDYSEWQQKWFKTDKVQQQLSFWQEELEGAPPLLELRMQRPRSSEQEQTFTGASQTVQLSDKIIAGIKALGVRLQATPFMLLLAAFKILLFRASGQTDLLVGVPVAGRNRVEIEELVGFFVNTLVLRDDLSGNPQFSELVAQVRETTLGAFANSDVPFEKVVEVLQPERNLSYNPIFQVMFAAIKAAVQTHTFGDLTAWPYVVSPNTSIFDLSMTIIEGVDGLWWAQIDHNTALFSSEDVSKLLTDYTMLLEAATERPELRIEDLPAMSLATGGVRPSGLEASDVGGSSNFAAVAAKSLSIAEKRAAKTKRRMDSKAARSTATAKRSSSASIASLPAEEKLLVGIWKDLLCVPEVGIDDNFFEVGGHSLLAAQVIAHVQSATGRKIAVSAVFRAPTIRAFAQLLREDALSHPDPIAMKLQPGASTVRFFGVAVPGVDTFGFAQLARHLPPDQPIYKLQASGPVVFGRPLSSAELQELAKRYVEAMRTEQPHGPYCIGAMCAGVVIAQGMILQLESQGEEVALFTIFDTWVRENSQIRSLWAIDYYMQRLRRFRTSSFDDKFATLRRIVARMTSRKNANPGRGWSRINWPKEDFQPPRFQAPVLLFKRPRQPYFYVKDPNMGWAARSLGGVTTCELECGHGEMLREPHVRTVANTLATRLQTVRNEREMGGVMPTFSSNFRPGLDSGMLAGTVA
jgi:thioesterase domain-containing protein